MSAHKARQVLSEFWDGSLPINPVKAAEHFKELLKDQAQTRNFRRRSFWGAWFFASLFFTSVIAFSWIAVVKGNAFQFKQPTPVEAKVSISTKVSDNAKITSSSG